MAITGQKESRTIEIEGNLTRLMRHTIEREVKTTDYLAELMKSQPLQSGPLPPGCVFHSRRMNSDRNIPILTYVLELGPHIRRMEMDYKRGNSNAGGERLVSFDCAWPSTLWIWRINGSAFQDLHLVGTKEPFMNKGMETDIFVMPTPNIHNSGQGYVCIGSPDQGIDVSKPAFTQVHALQQHMLVSYWNDDLAADYAGGGVKDLADWHEKTKADPKFAEKMKRRAHAQKNFAGLMAHLDGNRVQS